MWLSGIELDLVIRKIEYTQSAAAGVCDGIYRAAASLLKPAYAERAAVCHKFVAFLITFLGKIRTKIEYFVGKP